MSMKSNLGMLAFAAMIMSSESRHTTDLLPNDIDVAPKEPPIPKGCKRYYFNYEGICCKAESKVFFDSLTAKKAKDKYNKWLLKSF